MEDHLTKSFGISGEVLFSVCEKLSFNKLKSQPQRVTLPDAPAPTARLLEQEYYFDENKIVELILNIFNK